MRPIEHASMIPICQASGNVGVGGELPTRKPRQAGERPLFPFVHSPRFCPITRPPGKSRYVSTPFYDPLPYK